MMSLNPLLLVGGVIGTVSVLLLIAYACVKDKKTAMGFERSMADGEILRRLFGYAKPYLRQFVVVGFLVLFSISYDIASPLIVGYIEELVVGDFELKSLYVSVASACAWFTPELLSLDQQAMEAFYQQCPELELYRRNLDRIFRRKEHTLSPAEEALLASAGEMAAQPDNIYSMFADADLTFADAVDSQGEKHPVTHGTYGPLLYSQDRTLRKSAFESCYAGYGQFRNTCAATLNAQTKQLKFFADARKYPNTLAAALDRSAMTSDEARLDRDGVAVVIGNEGSGLSTEMIEACGKTVFIPISARSESLNASVAASIFLWEMRRRR